jgi:hypothetical protein
MIELFVPAVESVDSHTWEHLRLQSLIRGTPWESDGCASQLGVGAEQVNGVQQRRVSGELARTANCAIR